MAPASNLRPVDDGPKKSPADLLALRLAQLCKANPGRMVTLRVITDPEGRPTAWVVEGSHALEGLKP